MIFSGNSLSAFGRTALSNVGGSRTPQRESLRPVDPTDPLKDPTSSEYRELRELVSRDREVRQHEQAHVAAGGPYVRGGASFSYQQGPDGQRYATGGEVSIDTAPIPDDPAATIRKMQVVRSAALAPAEPSAQDRRVAAEAAQAAAQARADLAEEQRETRETSMGNRGEPDAPVEEASEPEVAPTPARAQSALASYRDPAINGNVDHSDRGPGLDLMA
jgi:hypothetical protein